MQAGRIFAVRISMRASGLLILAWLLIAFNVHAAERVRTLGDRQVFEFIGRDSASLLPAALTLNRLTLERAQLRATDSPGTLTVVMKWGDDTFAADAEAASRRRIEKGEAGYQPVVSAPALVSVHLPAGDGKIRRFERAIALPLGREETVVIGIGADAFNATLTIFQQAGAVPPITVEILWEDVNLSLNTEGRPNIQVPQDTGVRQVAARLPTPFKRPQDLLLRTAKPTGGFQETTLLQNAYAEIPVAASVPTRYQVVQPVGSSLENVTTGILPPSVSSTDFILPVSSRDLIIDIAELAKIPAAVRYVILWIRDNEDAIWQHYSLVVDHSRPMIFRIVHQSGVNLKDGLLLGFNENTALTAVMAVSSDTFSLDDVFLKIENAKTSADSGINASAVRWLEGRAASRVQKAVQARWKPGAATTSVKSNTASLVKELTERNMANVRAAAANLSIASASKGVASVHALAEEELSRRSPGLWAAIGLSMADNWATAEVIIRDLSLSISTSGDDGDFLREELIGAFERLGPDPKGQRRQFAQLMLSRGKANLTAEQRRRYWKQLVTVVVPRDATLDEGFLLATQKPVYLQSGTELRRVDRFLDRLSVDFSTLSTPAELSPLESAKNISSLRLNLKRTAGGNLLSLGHLGGLVRLDLSLAETPFSDQDLRFISGLKSVEELTIDVSSTTIKGAWLSTLQDLPRLRRLSINMSDCRELLPANINLLSRLAHLSELNLNLEGAASIDDKAMAALEGLKGLQKLSLYIARTQVKGKIPVSREYNVLDQLSISLPADFDGRALSTLEELPRLKKLAIRTEIGAGAFSVLNSPWIRRPLGELQLQMRGSKLTDAEILPLASSNAEKLLVDLSDTTVSSGAALKVCEAGASHNVRIILNANSGCQSKGYLP